VVHHVRADTTVLVVVDVGPADADCADAHEDLTWPDVRDRPLHHLHVADPVQDHFGARSQAKV
jgi:hypothetical protein